MHHCISNFVKPRKISAMGPRAWAVALLVIVSWASFVLARLFLVNIDNVKFKLIKKQKRITWITFCCILRVKQLNN